jgi:excinuclease ABC subunit C
MLKRIPIDLEQKSILEKIANGKIILRNTETYFGQNYYNIKNLMETGKQNALIYLGRQRLGQRLNPIEENNLFTSIVLLKDLLQLPAKPRRIECYDISHINGKNVYGSMVTFIDGRAEKKLYRLFKCPDQNNDFENHKQVLSRRFQRAINFPDDKGWSLPDLIIVDGGKGQLSSDYEIVKNFNLENTLQIVSLAKKEEEIFLVSHEEKVNRILKTNQNLKLGKQGGILPTGDIKYLVQRIRDEAHRFAITNNRQSRLKAVKKSFLDDIVGLGEKSKIKILSTFGSVKNFIDTLENNQELIQELLGEKLTEKVKKHLGLID